MEQNLYIWQKHGWPAFRWDAERLQPLLYEAIRNEAYFLGRISALDSNLDTTAFLDAIENEVISSSSIEDIMLNRDSVRSSILSRLGYENEGLHKSDRHADGAVSIVIDAVMNNTLPLTKERLFAWHTELFPSGISDGRRILTGRWRQGEMYVVSGRTGKEVIHYEAPPAEQIDEDIDTFLYGSVDDIVKALQGSLRVRCIIALQFRPDCGSHHIASPVSGKRTYCSGVVEPRP